MAATANDAATRIFLTGGTGYLGGHFLSHLLRRGEPVVVEYTHHSQHALNLPSPLPDGVRIESRRLDLVDEAAVSEVICQFRPDFIVHTAAMCNTSACDKDPSLAHACNVEATRNIVRAMQKMHESGHRCHLIHLSTDWVYSGLQPLVREDACDESSTGFGAYGCSKREGERVVQQGAPEQSFTILRSALMYGAPSPFTDKHCFFKFILDGISSEQGVSLFSDEYRSPVCVDYVVHVLMSIIESVKSSSSASDGSPFRVSVLNMGGLDRLSRLELGWQMCDELQLPRDRCRPTTLAEAGLSNTRPADLSMDSSKLHAMTSEKPRAFREHFADIMQQIKQGAS